jgi:hypothetical protein
MSGNLWVTLSDVPASPLQWLWDGRMPFGKVTLVDGAPGTGKSAFVLDIAARVSRGQPMPMGRGTLAPADVIIFTDDDSLGDTVRPRLESAGADLAKIHAINRMVESHELVGLQPALIIIDPLSAYLCLTDCPPRRAIKDLGQLAKETNAAVVAIQYLPTGATSWSGDIIDAARSVLSVSSLGHGRRRLSLVKSNVKPASEVIPLVFQLENVRGAARVSGWADGI